MSSLDPFLTQLETAWTDGSHNGAARWRAMKTKGFTGSLRVVTEWVTRKRKDERAATRDRQPGKTPSARRIARMMTTERDTPSKVVARTVAIIGAAVPELTSARDLLDRFHRLIRHRKDKRQGEWLTDAKPGLMASFPSGIAQDHAAVKAALTEHGQTVRPRGRTRSSNWSSGRCMGEPISTCCGLVLSGQRNCGRPQHQDCVRAPLRGRFTSALLP
jgi:transposase